MNLLFVVVAVVAGTWLAKREHHSAAPARIVAFDKFESEVRVLRQRSEELRDRSIDSVEATNSVSYDIYMAQRAASDTLSEYAP